MLEDWIITEEPKYDPNVPLADISKFIIDLVHFKISEKNQQSIIMTKQSIESSLANISDSLNIDLENARRQATDALEKSESNATTLNEENVAQQAMNQVHETSINDPHFSLFFNDTNL